MGRSATGADNSGSATRSAACALSGSGPGATRALRASPRRRQNRCARAAPTLTNPKSFGDLGAGPAGQRQQDRPRPVRLGPIRAAGDSLQRPSSFLRRRHSRFARHAPSSNQPRERNHDRQSLAIRMCVANAILPHAATRIPRAEPERSFILRDTFRRSPGKCQHVSTSCICLSVVVIVFDRRIDFGKLIAELPPRS